ncbi:MAG: hypothetical protein U0271_22015 [Polyangiaceae bacterium]
MNPLRNISITALSALALAGCDPPCEPYWKIACERCDATGCDLAKEHAKKTLEGGQMCQEDVARLKEILEQPGGKKVACNLPAASKLPSNALLGRWSCTSKGRADNGRVIALDIGLLTVNVDDKSFEVVQLSDDWANLSVSSQMQTSCNIHVEGERMVFRCATPLGSLEAGDALCSRAAASPASSAQPGPATR